MEWIPRNNSFVQRNCFLKEYQGRATYAFVLWHANGAVLVKTMYVCVYNEQILICSKLVEIPIVLKIWPIKQAKKRHKSLWEFIFHVEIMALNKTLQSSHSSKTTIHLYVIFIWLMVITIITILSFLNCVHSNL